MSADVVKLRIDAPRCNVCGGQTRLIGLEPHADKLVTDVLTFQCAKCLAYEVAELPGGQYAGPEIIVVP
jgi:hypothetical protein